MPTETLNYLLAIGTLVMQVVTLGFIAAYFLAPKFPELRDVVAPFERWGIQLGLILSIVGAALTLYYSEVLGFEPCFLCWWQRIFLYPQVVLFALASWRPGLVASAALYSICFSVLGAFFAAYHHIMQMFPEGTLPCSANGPSCAQITFIEFGYVTYPMMALSLFALLIVLMLFVRNRA